MNKKQLLTGAAAAAFALSTTLGALGAPGVKPMYHINVNGNYMENTRAFVDGDNTIMLPLRAITEEMGFTVTWNAETRRIELLRGPVYVTLTQDTDGYTFSRTAPMLLGKAPVTIDDRTYVPENFFDEILQGTIDIETNGEINITFGQEAEEEAPAEDVVLSPTATISEITEEGITVEDAALGTVILVANEETVITNHEEETLAAADLAAGMQVVVEYGPVMTASLPPINNPISIHVLPALDEGMAVTPEDEAAQPQFVAAAGKVVEVTEGQITILPEGMEDEVTNYLVLNIGDKTLLVDDAGKEIKLSDIKEGDAIFARHAMMMTMSIPAQSPAFVVELDENGEDNIDESSIDVEAFFAE